MNDIKKKLKIYSEQANSLNQKKELNSVESLVENTSLMMLLLDCFLDNEDLLNNKKIKHEEYLNNKKNIKESLSSNIGSHEDVLSFDILKGLLINRGFIHSDAEILKVSPVNRWLGIYDDTPEGAYSNEGIT